MRYSRRTRPLPSGSMSCSSPLRRPSASITRALVRFLDVDRQRSRTARARTPSIVLEDHARPATRRARSLRGACSRAGWSGAARRGPRRRRRSASSVSSTRSATLALQLALEALADLAAGDVLAFAAGERRGVDLEVHRQRRLVDLEQRQRVRAARRRQSVVADADVLDAVDRARCRRRRLRRPATRSRPLNVSTWLTLRLDRRAVRAVHRRRRPARP